MSDEELAGEFDRIREGLAKAFGWQQPSDDPRAITNILLDAAARLRHHAAARDD